MCIRDSLVTHVNKADDNRTDDAPNPDPIDVVPTDITTTIVTPSVYVQTHTVAFTIAVLFVSDITDYRLRVLAVVVLSVEWGCEGGGGVDLMKKNQDKFVEEKFQFELKLYRLTKSMALN